MQICISIFSDIYLKHFYRIYWIQNQGTWPQYFLPEVGRNVFQLQVIVKRKEVFFNVHVFLRSCHNCQNRGARPFFCSKVSAVVTSANMKTRRNYFRGLTTDQFLQLPTIWKSWVSYVTFIQKRGKKQGVTRRGQFRITGTSAGKEPI